MFSLVLKNDGSTLVAGKNVGLVFFNEVTAE